MKRSTPSILPLLHNLATQNLLLQELHPSAFAATQDCFVSKGKAFRLRCPYHGADRACCSDCLPFVFFLHLILEAGGPSRATCYLFPSPLSHPLATPLCLVPLSSTALPLPPPARSLVWPPVSQIALKPAQGGNTPAGVVSNTPDVLRIRISIPPPCVYFVYFVVFPISKSAASSRFSRDPAPRTLTLTIFFFYFDFDFDFDFDKRQNKTKTSNLNLNLNIHHTAESPRSTSGAFFFFPFSL